MSAIVLSIHREHADRIFAGLKLFELRKVSPKERPERIYLYESGGLGIVGAFDVGRIHSGPPSEVWRAVGSKATSKERFDRYYAHCTTAHAFEVKRPVALLKPIGLDELRQIRGFSPPQGFLIVRPGSALMRLLEDARQAELGRNLTLQMSTIEESDKALYSDLVTAEISKNYDEITPAFAEQTLKTATAEFDPLAFLTRRKDVLSARDQFGRLVGFTTLTRKLGDALKTGPTILLASFRSRGLGKQIRTLIETRARSDGVRKLYCTCPDNANETLQYLLAAGFSVEAHMRQHYSGTHGEFALGKHLEPPSAMPDEMRRLSKRYRSLTSFLRAHISQQIVDITQQDAERIASGSTDVRGRNYEQKPRAIFVKNKAQYISAASILIPKRGGAAKAVVLSAVGRLQSLEELVRSVEHNAKRAARRKLYFLHRADDFRFIRCLRSLGYRNEGLLQSPYRSGVDHFVLSKILSSN